MPSGRWYHCLAIVDQDRLFVTGGYVVGGSSADTYIYSNRTATWTKVKDAPMSPESYRASCGSVRDFLRMSDYILKGDGLAKAFEPFC